MNKVHALLFVTLSAAAFAEEGKFTYSGSLDGYYHWNTVRNAPSIVPGRGFDNRNERFRGNGVLNLSYEMPKWKWTGTLWAGDNADILYDVDTARSDWARAFRQFYFTTELGGWTFDFGKFDTPYGYELNDSSSNDNYSGSNTFTYAMPTYHTGIRFTKNYGEKASVGAMVVNGWNESWNGNDSYSLGAWYRTTNGASTVAQLGYYFGKEGAGAANNPAGSFGGAGLGAAGLTDYHLGDLVVSHKVSDRISVGLNAAMAHLDGPAAIEGEYFAFVGYGKYLLNEKANLALRADWFDDRGGLRTGTSQRLHSVTLTYNHDIAKGFRGRLEGRRDWSSTGFFNGRHNQSTITVAAEFKF